MSGKVLNSMKRRHFIGMTFAILAGAGLAGCSSFTPVYGDMSGNGVAAARFNFAPPQNRLEQVILNRLKIAFPGPALPTDPVLTVTAATSGVGRALSDTAEVAEQVTTRIEATLTITQGERLLFTTTRFTDSSLQSGKLTLTNISSASGTEETAARSTAESLRVAILAGYRPGMAPIAVVSPPVP